MSGSSGVLGYRELSPAEKHLINEIKAHGEKTRELLERVKAAPASLPAQSPEGSVTLDLRWFAIGTTHLQEGFMGIIRSIARPTTF